jgi:hypothetical protein
MWILLLQLHVMIVSDATFQSITLKSSSTLLEASFTLLEESFEIFIVLAEVVTIVNYDRNMFIVQATGYLCFKHLSLFQICLADLRI